MFKITSSIFFMLLDLLASTILIGAGFIIFAFVVCAVIVMVKSMITHSTTEKTNDE